MSKIKAGIIGTGFIGPAHVEALRRLGFVDVVAVAERGDELANAKAAALSIPKAYGDYRQLLADPIRVSFCDDDVEECSRVSRRRRTSAHAGFTCRR